MPSYVTARKGVEFIFYTTLVQQADTKLFQVNPTLAASDFTVSTDGGTSGNLTTTPVVTPAGGRRVKVTVSATEMNGDNISVVASDAAGAEWCDKEWEIQTTIRQIDDLCFPTVSGRGLDVSSGGEAGLDWANIGSPTTTVNLSGTSTKAVEPTVAGRTLDVSSGGEAGIDWANIGSPTTVVNLSGTSTKSLQPTVAGRTLNVSAGGVAEASLSVSERDAVADSWLNRDMSTGTDSGSPTVRTPRQALRALRNKSEVVATTVNVYKEDDVTLSWTGVATLNSSAVPITAIDPAS